MEQYIELLKTMIRDFEPMITTENQKIDAIQRGDLGRMDICMREEQANTLLLRGFEKKRLALQEQLGLGNLTLKEIVEQAPKPYRHELHTLSLHLQDSFKRFKAVNESANEILKTDMHYIDRILEGPGQDNEAPPGTYTDTRDKSVDFDDAPHFTKRKV